MGRSALSTSLLTFLLLLLWGFLGGCKDKWESVLSEKELESLFAELFSVQLLVSEGLPYSDDTTRIAYRNEVFAKYEISKSQFDSIVHYYAHYKADRLATIMTRASERLELRRNQFENIALVSVPEEAKLGEQLLRPDDLSTLIPEKAYPHMLVAGSGEVVAFHTARFIAPPNSGAVISIEVDIRAMHSLTKGKKPSVELLVSYEAPNSSPIELAETFASPSLYSGSLSIPPTKEQGSTTILLHIPSNAPPLFLYINAIRLSYKPLEEESIEPS